MREKDRQSSRDSNCTVQYKRDINTVCKVAMSYLCHLLISYWGGIKSVSLVARVSHGSKRGRVVQGHAYLR